ncbi:ATP-dependent RNA helicase HrpA [Jatrophihabitans telluris]|uniref:ATP-dependent RNA helicase HrpA n=1 Tax=Jatrophihabitans telluris TaxID=2038343 RepID=A0ABY4R6J5_9ACTN|nr:ATP-dependent RNA helicase HrpA [Jatrophihabitans telluris]UQX90159.1 ATP-dependent RNA helicase HrpA [Jatrophihabitans telluris]
MSTSPSEEPREASSKAAPHVRAPSPSAVDPAIATPVTAGQLRQRLEGLTLLDEHRLRRRLDASRRKGRGKPESLSSLAREISQAERRVAARRDQPLKLDYPEQLPVSQRRTDLLAAIAEHQVVVVAGETGSGKTTQLPKLCLELGRGVRGLIGHTQPRRIAARAVAERVAEELHTELGDQVGYAVRFTDQVSERTMVKLMTDGILLAEIQRDRLLRNYDTIIIDEAHERSLNIDFLLGYLQQLLPRRPDLKVIITSATIDPARFARYFGDAPIVEVSGRGYPVEIRYRPLVDPDDPRAEEADLLGGISDAVRELLREPAGDVLVFLSGEREIRDAADTLGGLNLRDTEILPLYARLSAAEQHRVFARHQKRRIVLATNVAETSLTVPGIKYVIDAGTARISRYSNRTKVQLLPIEPISQASAKQRAGRCGRTSDGVCIRLYAEADFQSRPEFTDPEILRTNLASVILQMAALELGTVSDFGFLDPPDRRQVNDGLALLHELGAITSDSGQAAPALTSLGRRVAQLPVDPRLARMILESADRGCVCDVLVLAAALSIQDPRERPAEAQQQADAAHARFADPSSDFVGYLKLWLYLRQQQKTLSSNQFRRMCRSEYLNYLRIREWQDLFTQLRQIAKGMGMAVGSQREDDPSATQVEQIHRSMLAGLLSHIGLKEGPRGDYLGARGAKFAIFPGSALFKKQPQFVMAAELVETSRLWARTNASIDSVWAEELASHLVKRSYSEPHWERRQAAVMATERVSLYGVALVAGRKVNYAQIDPVHAREEFIRRALVEGDWDTRHHFFRDNRRLVDEVHELETRTRRRDLLADDDTLFAFYDQRIPPDIVSGRHFDAWWKKARHRTPEQLHLSMADLTRKGAEIDAEQFPDTWSSGSFDLELSYRFEPGERSDGVTVTIPLPLLNDAAAAGLDWQVPGFRSELVTALLRGLPKAIRRLIVPVPDTAAELVGALPVELTGTTTDLTRTLSDSLYRLRGVDVPPESWDLTSLPDHLRPTYRIVDEAAVVLAEAKDLSALQAQFAPALSAQLRTATADMARDGLREFPAEGLPRVVQRTAHGHELTGYPSLVELASTSGSPAGAGATDSTVGIRVLDTEADQASAMWTGTRRLLALTVTSPARDLRAGLDTRQRLLMSRSPHGSLDSLLADCVTAAIDLLMRRHGGPVWTRPEFDRLQADVRSGLLGAARTTVSSVASVIGEAQQTELALGEAVPPSLRSVVAAEQAHLARLIYPAFVSRTPAPQLSELPRYLKAIQQRLIAARVNAARDAERQAVVDVVERDFAELVERAGPQVGPEALEEIRWMIEQLRVSLFAQQLGTSGPVSVKRIHAAMDRLDPR